MEFVSSFMEALSPGEFKDMHIDIALYGIFKFPDIAWPIVVDQHFDGVAMKERRVDVLGVFL